MNITEVRVKRLQKRSDRLRAFCSITIDGELVVHDLRIIEGRNGLFIAMPSRKITDSCPSCGEKNHLRAGYCNGCGVSLDKNRAGDKDKLHVDVAHPIVTSCREKIKKAIMEAYSESCRSEGAGDDTSGEDAAWQEDDREDMYPSEGVMDSEDWDGNGATVSKEEEEEEECGAAGEEETVSGDRRSERKGSAEAEKMHSPDEPVEEERPAADDREPSEEQDGRGSGGFGEGIL